MENVVIFLSDHVIITYHTESAQISGGRKLRFLMQITLLAILSYADAFPHSQNDGSMRVGECNYVAVNIKCMMCTKHLVVHDCLSV